MSSEIDNKTNDPRKGKGVSAAPPFSEAGAWRDVGAGWQPLFGSFRGVGYSIEWHDFLAKREFDWAASFHPGCVELCLNLEGHGFVEGRGGRTEFAPDTVGFYHRTDEQPGALLRKSSAVFTESISETIVRLSGADFASRVSVPFLRDRCRQPVGTKAPALGHGPGSGNSASGGWRVAPLESAR